MTLIQATGVTETQRREYDNKGYLVLRGVFGPDEVAAWKAECARLLASDYVDPNNLRTRPRQINDELVVERFDPVVDVSPVFAAVARDPRLTSAVRELYGEEMLLFKDKLIFKLPGMSGYGMHQDWAWWQPFAPPVVSVMVAIDGADVANGTLEVFPGCHHALLSTPGELRNMHDTEIASVDVSTGELLETEPGDVILFDGLTPHRSGPNTSERSRQQLYLSYSAARHGDQYTAQAAHYRAYNEAKMSDADKARLFFR
jgi:ectoine hydroxylase-related dioxygenase (phytanoyl-CoA dioxygenase family)